MAKVLQDLCPMGSYKKQKSPGFFMNGYIESNLNVAKKRVLKQNHDYVLVIDGDEGGGKTTLGFQCALFLDPTFNLSRVVFTPQQWVNAIKKAKKGQAIVFDEAMSLGSRTAMSIWNKKIVKMLSQIRSKNLFLIFIMPSIFELDRYIVLHRSKALFHVRMVNGRRGFYDVYGKTEIKYLYIQGKKYYNYNKVEPNLSARFVNFFPLDEELYESRKQESILNQEAKVMTSRERSKQWYCDLFITAMKDKLKLTYKDINKIVPELKFNHIISLYYQGKKRLNDEDSGINDHLRQLEQKEEQKEV